MIPVPLACEEELIRILKSRFLDNASAVVPEVFDTKLIYGAVHLSAVGDLLAYLAVAVPLGAAHVDDIIDRLEHLSVRCERET